MYKPRTCKQKVPIQSQNRYEVGSFQSSPIKNINNKLDWSVYTCLTQLYGGRDMYNLLHKDQLHVSALFIGHLQVDNWKT